MIITKTQNRQAFPELRGRLSQIRYPAYVEAKIDGEMNWYVPMAPDMFLPGTEDAPYLINKSGKMRMDFPVVDELPQIGPKLLGELYWDAGKAGDLYEFLKHQTDDELKYCVFDVNMPGPYTHRREWLKKNIKTTPHVTVASAIEVYSKRDAVWNYHNLINEGYEGVVVKNADSRFTMGPCGWVKLKKKDTTNYIVNAIDPDRERIEILVPTVDGDNRKSIFSHGLGGWFVPVGVKVSDKDKADLKVGDIVTIEHQGVLSNGGLRHPIFKGKIHP